MDQRSVQDVGVHKCQFAIILKSFLIPLTHSHQVEDTHELANFNVHLGLLWPMCHTIVPNVGLSRWALNFDEPLIVAPESVEICLHGYTALQYAKIFPWACNEYNFHFTLYLSTYRTTKGFFRKVKLRPITYFRPLIVFHTHARTHVRGQDTENDLPTNCVCVIYSYVTRAVDALWRVGCLCGNFFEL